MSTELVVEEAAEVTPALVEAFARLVPQLSSSSPPPTAAEVGEMMGAPGTTVFVARMGDEIVGCLTLVAFRIPTGVRARIEDVVVDAKARGRGAGEQLSVAAIEKARTLGAKDVDLTSRPSREAANRLYQRLGFVPRQTNVYRYTVSS
jgi:ribosomal protein S18 acetylase RimI-like enzyme